MPEAAISARMLSAEAQVLSGHIARMHKHFMINLAVIASKAHMTEFLF